MRKEMAKVFAYILGGIIIIIMFFTPAHDYVNDLFHRDRKEAREEEIIGRVSGYNPQVKEIQNILKEVGFNPGPADGIMGAQTRTAIKGFQKSKGLKTTSKIDTDTQLAINRMREQKKPSFKEEPQIGSWNERSSDDRNKQIQTALKKAGFYQGKIDGKIGPRTKAAISNFQKAIKLNPDGVVDKRTLAELNKYLYR